STIRRFRSSSGVSSASAWRSWCIATGDGRPSTSSGASGRASRERVTILRNAVRGLAGGLVAGATWALVEAAVNWSLGGLVPLRAAAVLLAIDLGVGAAAGLVIGLLFTLRGRTAAGAPLALGLAAAYALFRIYDPPGLGLEPAFSILAAGR